MNEDQRKINLTKRKPELKPGDEYTFMRDVMDPAVPLALGTEFTTERGTFKIKNLVSDAVVTTFVSSETEKGPTGDVRV